MQQITPIEIRQKSFGKRFRGYNPDEVDAFLHSLAYAWEKLVVQLGKLSNALEGSDKEVKRLQGVENALVKTLNDSESAAHNLIEQAKKEGELRLREAELEVEKMFQQANAKVEAIEEDSIKSHQIAKSQRVRELETLQKVVQETEEYRDTLLQKLQQLAEDILTKGKMIEGKMIEDSSHTRLPIDKDLKKNIDIREPAKNLPTVGTELRHII